MIELPFYGQNKLLKMIKTTPREVESSGGAIQEDNQWQRFISSSLFYTLLINYHIGLYTK